MTVNNLVFLCMSCDHVMKVTLLHCVSYYYNWCGYKIKDLGLDRMVLRLARGSVSAC